MDDAITWSAYLTGHLIVVQDSNDIQKATFAIKVWDMKANQSSHFRQFSNTLMCLVSIASDMVPRLVARKGQEKMGHFEKFELVSQPLFQLNI